jgi:hypothetical protein
MGLRTLFDRLRGKRTGTAQPPQQQAASAHELFARMVDEDYDHYEDRARGSAVVDTTVGARDEHARDHRGDEHD